MRSALRILVIVTLVASGLVALMWSQQRRLIYFPSPGPVPSAASVLPSGRDVVLATEDGIRLGAWYFPAGHTAVLVCNGNAGDRSMRAQLAAALNRIGHSVLLFDYRGYGGNEGYGRRSYVTYGYNAGADLSFECKVYRNGQIRDIDIKRRSASWRGY